MDPSSTVVNKNAVVVSPKTGSPAELKVIAINHLPPGIDTNQQTNPQLLSASPEPNNNNTTEKNLVDPLILLRGREIRVLSRSPSKRNINDNKGFNFSPIEEKQEHSSLENTHQTQNDASSQGVHHTQNVSSFQAIHHTPSVTLSQGAHQTPNVTSLLGTTHTHNADSFQGTHSTQNVNSLKTKVSYRKSNKFVSNLSLTRVL